MEDCLLWEGAHTALGSENSCPEEGEITLTLKRKKEAAETICDELSAYSFPVPLCYLGERGQKKIGSEVKLRKKEELGGMYFKIWLLFLVLL